MGKHCSPTNRPTTADATLAFTIDAGPDQIRAYWIHGDHPALHIQDGTIPAEQIPALVALLTESELLGPMLAVA